MAVVNYCLTMFCAETPFVTTSSVVGIIGPFHAKPWEAYRIAIHRLQTIRISTVHKITRPVADHWGAMPASDRASQIFSLEPHAYATPAAEVILETPGIMQRLRAPVKGTDCYSDVTE